MQNTFHTSRLHSCRPRKHLAKLSQWPPLQEWTAYFVARPIVWGASPDLEFRHLLRTTGTDINFPFIDIATICVSCLRMCKGAQEARTYYFRARLLSDDALEVEIAWSASTNFSAVAKFGCDADGYGFSSIY